MDKITVQHYSNAVEIIIKGNLNIRNTDRLIDEFRAIGTDGHEYKFVGINCEAMDSIDSSGLGALISISKKSEGMKADFFLCGLNRGVSSLFDISSLNKYFQVSTVDEFRKIVQP